MKRWPVILLSLLVLTIGGRFIYGLLSHPDDKSLIQTALADAVKASREGRPGSVIDKLAENFTVNGAQPGIGNVVQIVKNNHPEVAIQDTDPMVSGDTAQISSDVSVKVTILTQTQSFTVKDAQLLFKKEDATEWLIFPTRKWRLSAIRVPPDSIPTIPTGWGSQ
jgi:hypothetical protein